MLMDCDPGHDDAIALLLAAASPELHLRGVTTVAGNQILELTTKNALKVLEFAGVEVEVYAGCEKPLIRDLKTAPDVHGESGLEGPDLPDPRGEAGEKHAVNYLREELKRADEPLALVPTGPLTNIGSLLAGTPGIEKNIEKIIFMGGAVQGGNRTAAAEFNILVDPEAADLVINSGVDKTMVGLDVTRKARFLPEDIEEIKEIGNPVAEMAAELLDYFVEYHRRELDMNGCPLHDPLAVAALIDDTVIETETRPVRVETAGRFTTGSTVVDFDGKTLGEPNLEIAVDVDGEKFKHMVKKSLTGF